ncbi:Uncharacterised protein [Enterobacter cloacae]|nr:Uncharacterised protein [Enterobacter cloacae]
MKGVEVEGFNFRPRPWGPAQELQTRFNTRVLAKTVDFDSVAQFIPAISRNQRVNLHFKRYAMQRIVGNMCCHRRPVVSFFMGM